MASKLDDVTNSMSSAVQREADAPLPQTAQVCADKIVLKVGNLEIIAEGKPGQNAIPLIGTSILLDGKPFPVRWIKLAGSVDGVWQVEISFFPHKLKG